MITDDTSWSVIVPYFNEADFIQTTLECLAAQTLRPLSLILVNNASTDGSEDLVRQFAASHPDLHVTMIYEAQPGKTWALKAGLAAVQSDFVATCDADTFYPPDYIARSAALFADGGAFIVAAMAISVHDDTDTVASEARRSRVMRKSLRSPRKCHAGGYAQSFRTKTLVSVGGFDPAIWPYVLEDHEIVQRLLKRGRVAYAQGHWCMPSERRTDRTRAHWSNFERRLYSLTPFALKDWYFYRFLAGRFKARGLSQLRLREQSWNLKNGS